MRPKMSSSLNGTERNIPIQYESGPSSPPPIKFEVPMEARKNSIAQIGDKLVGMLDEIERRVENLRETAGLMEQEKESLMEMLQTVNMNKDMLRLGQSEKDDIDATTNRLIVRCKTVNVNVVTPRNPEQEKSLEAVNVQMEELVKRMEQDLALCKQTCKRYLNACAIDQPDGPIDQKFQSHVIGCTAEDQKKIRKRLEQLATLVTRSEQTVAQAHQ